MSGDHNMYASGSGDGQRSGWRKRTIMEMAQPWKWIGTFDGWTFNRLSDLEAFAALVREDEREACAKLAAKTVCDVHIPTGVKIYGTAAAKAIKARGNT